MFGAQEWWGWGGARYNTPGDYGQKLSESEGAEGDHKLPFPYFRVHAPSPQNHFLNSKRKALGKRLPSPTTIISSMHPLQIFLSFIER